MPYEAALEKAWDELAGLAKAGRYCVPLLGDTYEVDMNARSVFSASCNVPAKEFLAILVLHYLAASLKKGYSPAGEWVSFKDITGGEIYYPAFREGAIKPILRKYGDRPEALLKAAERFRGRAVLSGDAAVELETFKDVPVRIMLWRGDDEFGPEATILFNRNITSLFTMEDVAVLARVIAHSI
jgi:hypothetical protein